MEERKKQVLNAIIKDYIANAEPVGSRAVAKKYALGVSPATIRNEMSDLEEEGYIEQPHTSAGRIPSAKGYRYYVDNMMQREVLTLAQRHQVREVMSSELSELDSFMRSCCNMISHLTNYTAIAAVPERGRGTLLNIQLVPINDFQVLVILLASTGIVRHKLFELTLPIGAEQLSRLEQRMRRYLSGVELKNISYDMLREMLNDYQRQDRLAEQAFDLLEQTLSGETGHKIFTGGIMNMLSQPEFQDIEKLRNMMSLVEEEAKVEKLLQSSGSNRLTVTIGGEMPVEGAQDCSMVVANYFVDGEKAGSLGVLGPTRLNYSRTVSLMEFIAGELSQVMSDKDKNKE
jgi:heat-inducible transcriptional repressor